MNADAREFNRNLNKLLERTDEFIAARDLLETNAFAVTLLSSVTKSGFIFGIMLHEGSSDAKRRARAKELHLFDNIRRICEVSQH